MSGDGKGSWPGDLGTDYTVTGRDAQWAAFGRGLRTTHPGRRRAAWMLAGLAVLCAAALVMIVVFA